MSKTKSDLLEEIECLHSNLESAEEFNNNQAKFMEKLLSIYTRQREALFNLTYSFNWVVYDSNNFDKYLNDYPCYLKLKTTINSIPIEYYAFGSRGYDGNWYSWKTNVRIDDEILEYAAI